MTNAEMQRVHEAGPPDAGQVWKKITEIDEDIRRLCWDIARRFGHREAEEFGAEKEGQPRGHDAVCPTVLVHATFSRMTPERFNNLTRVDRYRHLQPGPHQFLFPADRRASAHRSVTLARRCEGRGTDRCRPGFIRCVYNMKCLVQTATRSALDEAMSRAKTHKKFDKLSRVVLGSGGAVLWSQAEHRMNEADETTDRGAGIGVDRKFGYGTERVFPDRGRRASLVSSRHPPRVRHPRRDQWVQEGFSRPRQDRRRRSAGDDQSSTPRRPGWCRSSSRCRPRVQFAALDKAKAAMSEQQQARWKAGAETRTARRRPPRRGRGQDPEGDACHPQRADCLPDPCVRNGVMNKGMKHLASPAPEKEEDDCQTPQTARQVGRKRPRSRAGVREQRDVQGPTGSRRGGDVAHQWGDPAVYRHGQRRRRNTGERRRIGTAPKHTLLIYGNAGEPKTELSTSKHPQTSDSSRKTP